MKCYAIRQTLVLAAILSVVSRSAAHADDTPPAITLHHRSLYQSDPIAHAHRIEIFGSIRGENGEGTICFDGNRSIVNDFGDVEISTAVSYFRKKVKFTRIEATDKHKRGREVYEVTGDVRRGLKLRLVVEPDTSPSTCRLIITEDNKSTVLALISLVNEDDHEAEAPKPELDPKTTKRAELAPSATEPDGAKE